MSKKFLTPADIPVIDYKCPCGGEAKMCRYALLCESCWHPCKRALPDTGATDPQKKLREKIEYEKFRRRHKHCFDCRFIKAVPIDVVCTNPEMKNKVPKGEK